MVYDDDEMVPRTADEYERQALGSTSWTAADARRVLSAHGVPGRSRLSADEARRMAAERWPEEVQSAREARVVRYRWPVAHGLRLTYAELAEVERRAGVTPLPSPGTRGAYASAGDVARVYEAGAAYRAATHSVRVRISCEDAADEEAARAVLGLLRGSYGCTEPEVYGRRHGGRAWYVEVAVPRSEGPSEAL